MVYVALRQDIVDADFVHTMNHDDACAATILCTSSRRNVAVNGLADAAFVRLKGIYTHYMSGWDESTITDIDAAFECIICVSFTSSTTATRRLSPESAFAYLREIHTHAQHGLLHTGDHHGCSLCASACLAICAVLQCSISSSLKTTQITAL